MAKAPSSLRARVALALLATAIALAIGELVLRATVVPIARTYHFEQDAVVADARRGYKLRPDHRSVMTNGFFREQVETDELGLRDLRDPTLPDPGIVAIGDSMTFGHGVAAEDTWVEQLQARLGVNVINAGVFGYGIRQYRSVLEDLATERPVEIVLYGMSWNDLSSGALPGTENTVRDGFVVPTNDVGTPGLRARLRRLSRRSSVLTLLASAGRRIEAAILGRDDSYAQRFEQQLRQTLGELADLQTWLEARGSRLVVVHLGGPTVTRPEVYATWQSRHGDLKSLPAAFVGLWCRQHGVPFSDAVPPLEARYLASGGERRSILLPVDLHYGAGGNEVIAEVFQDLLSQAGISSER